MSEIAWLGLGTIVATFVGPIAAVLITRFVDRKREQEQRRLDLFRLLMKSRRSPLSQDFVGGLNLIEIEFSSNQPVLSAWRALLTDFEQSAANSPAEDARMAKRRDHLRANLLVQMAKSLRFRIPDLEIVRGGYHPQGYVNAEQDQEIIRRFYVDIALGNKALPIINVSSVPSPKP